MKGTAGCSDPLKEYPAGFNAWLLNMQVVNIILPLDVAAFMAVVLRHAFVPSDCAAFFTTSNVTQSLLMETPEWLCAGAGYTATGFGIALGIMSIMGKRAAFDVIGHYAWFWGDFFYGLDLELKFDGIFDIAPHPMYTVGYGWMYGLSLMTGSSHVAALAFASHFMQIGFLILVEDPHINKLYGSDIVSTPRSSALSSPTKVPKSNVLLFNNFGKL
jgi:phosphatidylethanolamine N-methyltransferase